MTLIRESHLGKRQEVLVNKTLKNPTDSKTTINEHCTGRKGEKLVRRLTMSIDMVNRPNHPFDKNGARDLPAHHETAPSVEV